MNPTHFPQIGTAGYYRLRGLIDRASAERLPAGDRPTLTRLKRGFAANGMKLRMSPEDWKVAERAAEPEGDA